jgi:hypothetical protein
MDTKTIASQMRQEAKRLLDAASLIDPTQISQPIVTRINTNLRTRRTGARRMSAATRAKLSAAQQRRRARERGESIPEQQAA